MLYKSVLFGIMVFISGNVGYSQNMIVEYQPQNIQHVTTLLVPVTTVVNQTVWVPVVKPVPMSVIIVQPYTYYPPVAPVSYRRCCINTSYYVPYYHYKY